MISFFFVISFFFLKNCFWGWNRQKKRISLLKSRIPLIPRNSVPKYGIKRGYHSSSYSNWSFARYLANNKYIIEFSKNHISTKIKRDSRNDINLSGSWFECHVALWLNSSKYIREGHKVLDFEPPVYMPIPGLIMGDVAIQHTLTIKAI